MKRLLLLLLAIVLLPMLIFPAFAASEEAEQAAQALYELGIFGGTGTDENGNPKFDLDRTPTRHEAIIMLVRLLGKEQEAKEGVWNTPFTDVEYWAEPYVGYAYTNGLASGTSAVTYGGEQPVTVSQYLTFVLQALGYTSGIDFQWDRAWELSDAIGLTHGEYDANGKEFTRGDLAIISCSALKTAVKNSNATLQETLELNPKEYENPANNETIRNDISTVPNLENKSTNEQKIDILAAYRAGLENYTNGAQQVLDGLNYLQSGDFSDAYIRGYLRTSCKNLQNYIRLAIRDFENAITLCGTFSDTQLMKSYITEVCTYYSKLLDWEITSDNVFDFTHATTSSEYKQELFENITDIIDQWVAESVLGET